MCGIVGLWQPGGAETDDGLKAAARSMADAIAHRGPDDAGLWLDPRARLALGHRRLAIVDLSPAGHQPMLSANERYAIVFNGEIYNHLALRRELEAIGVVFRSNSDTEVMLEGFVHWGLAATVRKLAGMWAFALWDREAGLLHLCRDRLGKKPLYVYRQGRTLAFGSELKALWRVPGFQGQLNEASAHGFFRFGYVAENECILRNVLKVQPGELLSFSNPQDMQSQRLWSLTGVVQSGQAQRIGNWADAESQLLETLRIATRERMMADVPLGAFLSGGVDSGLVVALMQEAAQSPTRTFSIGFEEATHDEAPVARAVANHLGTQHTELYVTQRMALDLVPSMASVFDEPFADSSQLPTTLLAALARPHVTVALTGDGRDEAFGGYVRYRSEAGAMGRLLGLPMPLRATLGRAVASVPAQAWDQMARLVPQRRRPRFLPSKAHKLARALRSADVRERRKLFLTLWHEHDGLMASAPVRNDGFADAPENISLEPSEAMQFWETQHYLPGDLLTKMDRATMAASLEARSPLLDHRVVELAWRLPAEFKAGPQTLKHILRRLLFRYVPKAMIDLPKQGFSVPVGPWLTQDLRPWAEECLTYVRQELPGLVRSDVVDAAWKAHLDGRVGYVERLWSVLMFAQWHQHWLGRKGGA